ncbi:BspA family leucine-rich repeat surface protein [Xylocopilactobacillus apis]|uniref:Surface protein n=1 Tax=Xylocopilactobacillus apis TaxID=2932183 RepID=A0AAU9D0I8_9LACO|nr:BspA family leucine-rich repeat surface protein [Xylocopilactobacillus apis]BDR57159.1 hypothetical protein KIMC2_17210 [Xylocopilactobacillus apis]
MVAISGGGRLDRPSEVVFADPLQFPRTPKINPRINLRSPSTIVKNGEFGLRGESKFVGNQASISLDWDIVSDISDGYIVQRSTSNIISDNDTAWETAPTNYGKKIKILNVYPPDGRFLKAWMNQNNGSGQPVSMNLIDVDEISLSDFNANPDGYLKDVDGNYRYDGIYFGSSDSNGGWTPGVNDLTATSQPIVESFANTGRSIILGHDTLAGIYMGSHHYFNRFAPKLGWMFPSDIENQGGRVDSYKWRGANHVSFTSNGMLNQYPYYLDPTVTYNISVSHSLAQFYMYDDSATRWMQYEGGYPPNSVNDIDFTNYTNHAYDYSGRVIGDDNWYLLTKGNYAMIQTGHTTGQCTPDEAKIIANMVYYTSTLNTTRHGEDFTVKDLAAPDAPSTTLTGTNVSQLNLKVNTNDNPTDYYYRVKAKTALRDKYSDVIKTSVESGVKGYVYTLDSSPTSTPAVTKNPSTGEVTNINLSATSTTDPSANLSLSLPASLNKYLHIVAVDNSNNVSEVKHINLNDYVWWYFDSTTKVLTIYPHELNALVDAVIDSSVDPINPTVTWPWDQYKTQITKTVISPGVSAKASIAQLFKGFTAMTEIVGLTNLNTTEVTDYSWMFNDCKNLTAIDLSGFNTLKAYNMFRFLRNCSSVTDLKFGPNFITSNVTNFGGFFEGMQSIESIDMDHIDTSSALDMQAMFAVCRSLKTLDVSRLNTSNVKNMNWLFEFDNNLSEIDLSNFNTASLTTMAYMFMEDTNLKKITFGENFNTTNVTTMNHAFENCSSLSSLDLSSFTTNPNTMNMDDSLNGTTNLWKLTLGVNTKLSSTTGLANPNPRTPIIDLDKPVPPNPQYFATDAKWREIGVGGSDHEPKGDVKTASQIMSESATRNDVRTYVWDQRGRVQLEAPIAIDFGTNRGSVRNHNYESTDHKFKVTDNRNSRKNKKWRIEGAMTQPLTKGTKRITGNPLHHRNSSGVETNLTPVATLLADKVIPGVTYEDTWEEAWDLLFKTTANNIPEAGSYSGQITFTLLDAVP